MRVALTGGIGMGKTTVLRHVASCGVPVRSADEIVGELWLDPRVLREIGEALGLPAHPGKDAVRSRIAQDPAARRALNTVFHARVLDALMGMPAGVAEVPLLVESCTHALYDRVWVLACDPAEQLRRVVERLGDETRARSLIAAQIGPRTREAFADRILRTDSPLSSVLVAVEQAVVEDGLAPCSSISRDR